MEIILKEDIIGLGYKNDIVNVKSGYGRNYLIPSGKGVIASESAKKVLAENLKQQASKLAAIKEAAEKKAEALKDVKLVIPARVSATGATYGSVNANIVAEELGKKGFEIDRKIITMRDIKAVGDYEAVVHFHKDVEVKIPVTVIAEKEAKAENDTEAGAEKPAAKAEKPAVKKAEPVEAAKEESAPAPEEVETPATEAPETVAETAEPAAEEAAAESETAAEATAEEAANETAEAE